MRLLIANRAIVRQLRQIGNSRSGFSPFSRSREHAYILEPEGGGWEEFFFLREELSLITFSGGPRRCCNN